MRNILIVSETIPKSYTGFEKTYWLPLAGEKCEDSNIQRLELDTNMFMPFETVWQWIDDVNKGLKCYNTCLIMSIYYIYLFTC